MVESSDVTCQLSPVPKADIAYAYIQLGQMASRMTGRNETFQSLFNMPRMSIFTIYYKHGQRVDQRDIHKCVPTTTIAIVSRHRSSAR